MSEDMAKVFRAKWSELEGKVLTIAQQEQDNYQLQAFLATSAQRESMSSGKCCIVHGE